MPDVRTIPSQITRLALIYITGLALAVLGFGVLAFGKDVSISLGIDTVAVFPPMFLVLYLLLQKINNDLRAVIERALNGKSDEDDDRFIAGYPLKLVLCMIFIDLFSGIAMEVVSRVRGGVILGGVQIVFLITISTCLLAVTVSLLFYKVRIMLYSLGNRINYKPLNMFQKLAIPILSAILILLSLASVGIYRMTYGQVYSMRSTIIAVSVNKNMQFIDGYFGTTLGELKAHSMNPDVRSMRADRLQSVLRELRDTKDTSKIEMFLIADERGDTFTDMGGQSTNIAEREYYKKVMAEGRYIFSEPIVSKATQKEVVVCAVPVSRNGKTTGVIAATILADTIDELFAKDTVSETGRFMLISRDGRFIFHKNRTLVGKDIIKDFPDDGKNFINAKNLIQSGEGILFSYRFFGKDVFSYKVKVPVLDYYLVFSIDKNDFLKEINLVVIEIIAAFLVLSLITFFIIYRLAMNFSKPISNMTRVIKKLAEGDLTTENDDFLADEFGELIRNFKLFQARLREIIQRAMDAVVQLSTSAEELAATSSTLSEGAQSQAASVEEASASLEEVSGAVELINTNAGEQACLARDTFSSMEKLKKDNETVVGYAAEALKAAKNTTGQANTGQSLMENTIAGMNSIDESTKKIAETVRLISDISDQVNLLALNASIEAARAGEHGKGFAVVAEEISKLADETASSAKTINDLVKTGLGEVGRGREYVDATGAALKNIIGYISHTEELVRNITESAESQAQSSQVVLGDTRKVMEMAESISSSTNEQMMTNQEMSKTVEQINQNTQSSAAAAEQIASSAEEISAQAESLRQQMEFFRVG